MPENLKLDTMYTKNYVLVNDLEKVIDKFGYEMKKATKLNFWEENYFI